MKGKPSDSERFVCHVATLNISDSALPTAVLNALATVSIDDDDVDGDDDDDDDDDDDEYTASHRHLKVSLNFVYRCV